MPLALLILALIVLGQCLVWRMLARWLGPLSEDFPQRSLGRVLCALSVAAVLLALPFFKIPEILRQAAFAYLIFGLYLSLAAPLLQLLSCLLGKVPALRPRLKARSRARGLLALALLCALLIALGFAQAQPIALTRYALRTEALTEGERYRFVLISDLHLSLSYGAERVERVAELVAAEEADAVFIVGDIFDDDFRSVREPERVAVALGRLRSRWGTYLVWGNHDRGAGFAEMRALIEGCGIHILEEEMQELGERFTLLGRVDPAYGGARPRRAPDWSRIDPARALIVLDHRPTYTEEYEGTEVDLILSGHTHQGQVFPATLIARWVNKYNYGLHRLDDGRAQILVTSGVGGWGPRVRLGSSAEVVSFTLSGAEP